MKFSIRYMQWRCTYSNLVIGDVVHEVLMSMWICDNSVSVVEYGATILDRKILKLKMAQI